MRLQSARAKVARAGEHLDRFAEREAEYHRSVGRLADAEVMRDGSITYRRAALPELPDAFSLLAGDCVQNARAALDHAVFALSTSSNPSFTASSFPVARDHDSFERQRPLIRYLPSAHQAFIEAIQPYNNGPADLAKNPLWQLHDLARIDRHRLIPTLVAVARAEFVERLVQSDADDDQQDVEFGIHGSAEAGDVLLTLPPPARGTLAYRPQWELYVSTEDGTWLEPLLRPIVIFVGLIVEQMESSTPQWPPED